MPKRYYCDYCQKSFQDNPRNRKRHLTGATHMRLKKQHYDSIAPEFKHPAARILYSGMSGEEILRQWIAKHPEVQKRYREYCNSIATIAPTSHLHHHTKTKSSYQ